MNRYVRLALHAIYAAGLLLIIAFSGSKYGWMADVDPSISVDAIEDGSGNRAVFSVTVLVVAIAAEVIVAIRAKTTMESLISGLLVLVAILAFAA